MRTLLARDLREVRAWRSGLAGLAARPSSIDLSLTALGRHVFGRSWIGGRHLALLDRELQSVLDGDTDRLIIQMPPRYAKTTMACQLFAPLYLARHPDRRVIYTTYQAGKGAEWGRKSRDVTERFGHLLGLRVRQDSRASNHWDLVGSRGGMMTAGVGGPLVGSGADVLIIDDPIKNHEEADSPLIRQKLWDWFDSTAKTRLEPGGAVVMIMHRWRRDDLVGTVLDEATKTGEDWRVVNLPALAEEDDVLGRKVGQCLWPQRFPQQEVEDRKKTTAPRWWNALYQQRPANEDGAEWPEEWLTYDGVWADEFPEDPLVRVMALDPSKGRLDKPGDYSAYTFLAAGRDGLLYLGADLDNRRSAEKIVADGIEWVRRFRPDGFALEANAFQELFGLLFKQAAERAKVPMRFGGEDRGGGPVLVKYTNTTSKVGRIRQWGDEFAHRRVRFVRSLRIGGGTIPLNTEVMVRQFLEFPHCTVKSGGHDDGADSAQMGLRLLKEFRGKGNLVQKIREGKVLR